MDINSRISKNHRIPYRIIGGEGVLVDVEKGAVAHLTPVAASIWDFVGERTPVIEVAEHIQGKFDVDTETAARDTLEFITLLEKKGFLKEIL